MFRYFILIIILSLLTGCGHHLYHRAEPGDTLYSISWQYGYDYKTVAQWNNISSPYRINSGQIIHLAPQKKEVARTLMSKTYEVVEPVQNVQVTEKKPEKKIVSKPAPSPPKKNVARPKIEADKKYSDGVVASVSKQHMHQQSNKIYWRWPTRGKVIANFKSKSTKLKGLDISGALGQPIRAAAPGQVVYSGNALKGYGNLIIIKHNDSFLSAYAHNKDILVIEDEYVERGQKIAEMGRSDRDNIALHFQIRKEGKPVDPSLYLPRRN